MRLDKNMQVFFALVRAGLWEKIDLCSDIQMLKKETRNKAIDWNKVYRQANEQSVLGLVLAGIGYLPNEQRPPKVQLLQWIGEIQIIEQRNRSMNNYISWLIERLKEENIYAILVKGQGIAQCYNQPLWRSSGDVDLLFSETNYEKAKRVLIPLANSVDKEFKLYKHLGLIMPGKYVVELHGTLHCRLSRSVDRGIDEAQRYVFDSGGTRSWINSNIQVFLPAPDSDVIFLFTHILKHFYQGGVGLKQICDLCRFLWIYHEQIDKHLLKKRLIEMKILQEWKAFAAYMADFLGMPIEAIPLYSIDGKWSSKAKAINSFVMEVGNFGHKRVSDTASNHSFLVNKAIAFWHRTIDSFRHFFIFPVNSIKAWWMVLITGINPI